MNYLLSRAEMGTAGPRNQESRILCPLAFLRKCGGGGGGGGRGAQGWPKDTIIIGHVQ